MVSCFLISCCLLFLKEYILKHMSLRDTKPKNDYRDSPKHVAISNISLTLQDEECFPTTLTPGKRKEDICKEMCDETAEEEMIGFQNIHLKTTESRSVAWETLCMPVCATCVQTYAYLPETHAFVSEDSGRHRVTER